MPETIVKEVKRRKNAVDEWRERVESPAKALVDSVSKEELKTMIQEVRKEAIEAGAAEAAKGQEEHAIETAKEIDALDELQIAEEMAGRVVTQYFYEFSSRGRTITGISLSGIKAIARQMAMRGEAVTVIDAQPLEGEDTEGPWVGFHVKVRNLRTGEERFGYAQQSMEMQLRDGRRMPDPFARTKALNKAQRNGLRWFIPEVVIISMYKAWKGGKPLKEALEEAAKSHTQELPERQS